MSECEWSIWTVGHSTRSLDEFLYLLRANGIELVADVRRHAGSRKYPQFGQETLRKSLAAAGIAYEPLPELGGRRRPRQDTRNTVWRNESFRGYADHMETAEFRAGIERLRQFGLRKPTAIMCAEAVWWRCHRALIADYLKAEGICVQHIMSATDTRVHPYTSAARIRDGELSYSPED